MGRYRTSGGLDDVRVDDGDMGFLGVNARLPVWQLGAGMLALSENGRIDGDWRPRKGVEVLAEGVEPSGSALRLPFWLVDDVGGVAVTAAALASDVVTLTATGHGLPVDAGSIYAVLDPAGSNNGVRVDAVAGVLSGVVSVEVLAVGDFGDVRVTLIGQKVTVALAKSVMTVGGALSPDATGTLYYVGEVAGYPYWTSTGLPVNINTTSLTYNGGQWVLTKIGATIFDIDYWRADAGSEATPDLVTVWTPTSPATGTPTVTAVASTGAEVISALNSTGVSSALLVATDVAGSDGSGSMVAVAETFLIGGASDAAYLGVSGLAFVTTDPNGVHLVTPTDANTLTYALDGANETFTAGAGDNVRSVLDDFAVGDILAACVFSDPGAGNEEYVFLALGVEVKAIKLSTGAVTTYGLPAAETLDGEVSMIQAMDKVLIFRGGKVGMEWSSGDTDFALVPAAVYSQPQVLDASLAEVASGVVTFTVVGNNTMAVGDWVTIYSSTDARFSGFVGQQYECVGLISTTGVKLQMPVPNSASAATDTQIGRRVSVGGGFIHAPGLPWGVYFQRRIWGPYQYFWDVSLSPDAFTDREVRDEVIASDILDSDTFDAISNQFRITGGVADYLVGLHPFFDDVLLVMMRNSIHAIAGTIGSLLDTTVKELTREIGCLARKSVVSQGNRVFFLSDNGVYGLEFADAYNLRGIERPLSENIQPYIDRISWELAADAVGIYHNNRYWLAVPLDSAPRQGDAVGNNAILVFNLLNREWESVDTFSDPGFLISDMLIGTAGARNDLFAVTSSGGIHILDRLDEDFDRISSTATSGTLSFPISSAMTTRGYVCGTVDRKRFAEIGANIQSGAAQCDVGLSFSTEDPDMAAGEVLASTTLGEILSGDNTADLRARVGGVRGYTGQLRIERKFGRPVVRSTKVSATVTNRAVLSQK